MPRYGLEFSSIASTSPTGVERYIYDIAKLLPSKLTNSHFYCFVDRRCTKQMMQHYQARNVTIVRLPFTNRLLYQAGITFVSTLLWLKAVHFPSSIIPTLFTRPAIISVYDLTYEKRPDFYTPQEVSLQKKMVRRSAVKAQQIITISNATRDDLIHYYGVPENKVHVIYLPLPNKHKIMTKKRLVKKKIILAVGNMQPRKNFVNLVHAMNFIPKNYSLVLCGKPQDDKEVARIKRAVKSGGLEKRVTIKGFVTDEELSNLYATSTLLAYPSFFEGYGYPLIEAFSAGLPVVTSDASCMPEIAGDAAIYIDPHNPQSLAGGINMVIQKKDVSDRLIKLGYKRLDILARYDIGEETAAVYNMVGAES